MHKKLWKVIPHTRPTFKSALAKPYLKLRHGWELHPTAVYWDFVMCLEMAEWDQWYWHSRWMIKELGWDSGSCYIMFLCLPPPMKIISISHFSTFHSSNNPFWGANHLEISMLVLLPACSAQIYTIYRLPRVMSITKQYDTSTPKCYSH